jgi:ketosteroid isomerase-like protein
MLKQSVFALVLFFTLSSMEAGAQTKEIASVQKAVETLRQAMVSADSSKLSALTMSELSYGHSGGRVEDKASFISAITTGKSDFVTIDLSDQTVQVVGKTAIVRHTLSAKTNDNGQPGSVKLAILTVWQKDKKQWKLLARQAVRL